MLVEHIIILHDNSTCHKSYTIQVSESHQTNYIHHTSQLRIFLTLNLTSQHTSWAIQHVLQKTSTGRPGTVRASSESSLFHWTFSLRIANRRMQFERRAHTDTHSHAHFLKFNSETHLDALRTLSALLIVKVGLSKLNPSSRPCWLALPLCDGTHIHDLDILKPTCSHA